MTRAFALSVVLMTTAAFAQEDRVPLHRFHDRYPVNPLWNRPAMIHATVAVLGGGDGEAAVLVRRLEFDAPRGLGVVSAWQAHLLENAMRHEWPGATDPERLAEARLWFDAEVASLPTAGGAVVDNGASAVTAPKTLVPWQEAMLEATGVAFGDFTSYSRDVGMLRTPPFYAAEEKTGTGGWAAIEQEHPVWAFLPSGQWFRWAVHVPRGDAELEEFMSRTARYPIPRNHLAGAYLMRSVVLERYRTAPGMPEREAGMAVGVQPGLDLAVDRWRWSDVPARYLRQRRLDMESWAARTRPSPRNHYLMAQGALHLAARERLRPGGEAAHAEECLALARRSLEAATALLGEPNLLLEVLDLSRRRMEGTQAPLTERQRLALGQVRDPLDAAALAAVVESAEVAQALNPWARAVAEARRAHPERPLPEALRQWREEHPDAWSPAAAWLRAELDRPGAYGFLRFAGDEQAARELAGADDEALLRLLSPVLLP